MDTSTHVCSFRGLFRRSMCNDGPIIMQVRPFLLLHLEQGTWTARNGEIIDLTQSLYYVPFLELPAS